MTYQELKEIYKDIQKDRYMIYILRGIASLICIVLLLAIIIFIEHAVVGKPAKLLFGLAEINTVKTDTFYKIVQQKKDTVYKETIKYLQNENFAAKSLRANVVAKKRLNS